MAVSVGARLDVFTWASYHRWPVTTFVFMLISTIVGAAFAGLDGMLIGFIGGTITGFVIGFAMGKDKNLFPARVNLKVAYGGGKPLERKGLPGRLRNRSATDPDTGVFVEYKALEYLDGMTIRPTSNYDIHYWNNVQEVREVNLTQVSSNKYLVEEWHDGVLMIHDVPVYKFKDIPKYICDANGNKLKFKFDPVEKVFVTNQEGKLIPDENGQYFLEGYESVCERDEKGQPIIDHLKSEVSFNTNVMMKDGDLVKIPKGIAADADNEKFAYTNMYAMATMFNKTGGWWTKWGGMVFGIICMALILTISIFAYIELGKMSKSISENLANQNAQSLEVQKQTNQLVAQISTALFRMGYNYNATITSNGVSPSASTQTPPPVAGDQQLKIPFVSG